MIANGDTSVLFKNALFFFIPLSKEQEDMIKAGRATCSTCSKSELTSLD